MGKVLSLRVKNEELIRRILNNYMRKWGKGVGQAATELIIAGYVLSEVLGVDFIHFQEQMRIWLNKSE